MAQTRYLEYRQDDATDMFNRWGLGINGHGVYKGFDVKFADTSGTDLVLYHELTGYKDVSSEQVQSSFKGLIRTQQGIMLIEDGEITIGASEGMTGNAVANPRIDIVYIEHARVETVGGIAATYGVKAGTAAATPTIPTLDTPLLQIPIAYIYWPASTSDLSASGVKIVRISIAQTVDYQQPRMQVMTYDATNKQLTSQYRSNFYYIANIDSDYKEVDRIFLNGFNPVPEVIHVFTKQRLWVDSTGDFNPRARVTGRTLIEPGELLTFARGAEFDIPGAGFYTLVRGDEMRRDSTQKITGQIVHNRGTGSINTSTGEITLNGDGNMYQLEFDFNTVTDFELKALTTFASYWDGTHTRTKDGAFVLLRLKNTGASRTLTIIDGATPSSSSFAAFDLSASNSYVTDDAYLVLVQADENWHVVLNVGTTVDSWVDAGTTVAVVTDTGTVTIAPGDVVYNKFRIHNGTLYWKFYAIDITISGSPTAMLFQLPTAIQDLDLGIVPKGITQLTGMFDTGGTPASLYATIGKNVAGVDSDTDIVIRKTAATAFSNGADAFDISFNVDFEMAPV